MKDANDMQTLILLNKIDGHKSVNKTLGKRSYNTMKQNEQQFDSDSSYNKENTNAKSKNSDDDTQHLGLDDMTKLEKLKEQVKHHYQSELFKNNLKQIKN